MIHLPFRDRTEAGQALGAALQRYVNIPDTLVLALPRGGVPVGAEVARALGADLDILVVRKLGTPGQRELAMGAIASGGARVLNEGIINALRIPESVINDAIRRETAELRRREENYRGRRPSPEVRGKTVFLVDDGLATGATMRAAVAALAQLQPAKKIVAIPVAPLETVEILRREADGVECLATPEPFMAVGRWYEDFPQTSDAEVRELLADFWKEGIEHG